jgi:hypothetical protein
MGKFNSLGLIVISIALLMLFFKPQLGKIDQINQRKAAYNQAISDLQHIDQKKNELLAKLNSFPAEDVAKIDTLLPDKPNVVPLVAELENIASKRGIIIRNISTDSSGNFSASLGGEGKAKNYETSTLNFDFESSYDVMKQFLIEIESSLRVMDIRSVNFSGTESNNFTYKVTMDIYWINPKAQVDFQPAAPITPI